MGEVGGGLCPGGGGGVREGWLGGGGRGVAPPPRPPGPTKQKAVKMAHGCAQRGPTLGHGHSDASVPVGLHSAPRQHGGSDENRLNTKPSCPAGMRVRRSATVEKGVESRDAPRRRFHCDRSDTGLRWHRPGTSGRGGHAGLTGWPTPEAEGPRETPHLRYIKKDKGRPPPPNPTPRAATQMEEGPWGLERRCVCVCVCVCDLYF